MVICFFTLGTQIVAGVILNFARGTNATSLAQVAGQLDWELILAQVGVGYLVMISLVTGLFPTSILKAVTGLYMIVYTVASVCNIFVVVLLFL